jgi:hypothetical protein
MGDSRIVRSKYLNFPSQVKGQDLVWRERSSELFKLASLSGAEGHGILNHDKRPFHA